MVTEAPAYRPCGGWLPAIGAALGLAVALVTVSGREMRPPHRPYLLDGRTGSIPPNRMISMQIHGRRCSAAGFQRCAIAATPNGRISRDCSSGPLWLARSANPRTFQAWRGAQKNPRIRDHGHPPRGARVYGVRTAVQRARSQRLLTCARKTCGHPAGLEFEAKARFSMEEAPPRDAHTGRCDG